MDNDLQFTNRIHELARLSFDRNIVTYTDFMDLNELHMINNLNFNHSGVTCRMFGGYEIAERQMAAFIPDALSYDWEYPIACMAISPYSLKFSDKLSHRDYLGALLNLGLKRSVLGDILIQEQGAYLFCLERMSGFLTEHLRKIRHTQVGVERVAALEKAILPDFEEITGTVASVRLDAVIGIAFHTSRSSMTGLIEGQKVYVNGRRIVSNGYTLTEKDIVSVRGHGKFQFCEILSQTKKGRIRIRINRYV